jgi:hypothetical protein
MNEPAWLEYALTWKSPPFFYPPRTTLAQSGLPDQSAAPYDMTFLDGVLVSGVMIQNTGHRLVGWTGDERVWLSSRRISLSDVCSSSTRDNLPWWCSCLVLLLVLLVLVSLCSCFTLINKVPERNYLYSSSRGHSSSRDIVLLRILTALYHTPESTRVLSGQLILPILLAFGARSARISCTRPVLANASKGGEGWFELAGCCWLEAISGTHPPVAAHFRQGVRSFL